MIGAYLKLGVASLLPVIAAAGLYLLEKRTKYGELTHRTRQIITGVVFGLLAVVGTEWGIPLNGAQVNARDAAVLTAGLVFGGQAGILAGLIGGIERWVAVAWGVGTFTRVACTVSTILAGFYAALLRRHMLENKRPSAPLALAIGVVMETLHLTMVFITNMATPDKAMDVVRVCTVPMLAANGVSVMLACLVISLLEGEGLGLRKGTARISQTVQRWLLLTVTMAFAVTTLFVTSLQTQVASRQTDSLLDLAMDSVTDDIKDTSDENMLALTHKAVSDMAFADLETIAARYDISEISLVDRNGVITDSTEPKFIGFDMHSGKQSRAFLCLLKDEWTYVQDYGPITYDRDVSRKYAGQRLVDGFIQIGYDAEHFQKDIDAQVVGITKNRHVGQNGFILIIDEGFNVVSAPAGYEKASLVQEAKGIVADEGETFTMSVEGEKYLCRYRFAEGYYIIAMLPKSEAMQTRNVTVYVNVFLEILVFALLFGLIYLLIKRVVVDRIMEVNASLAKITAGDLDEEVCVRSNAEFVSLSDDINHTVDTLKHYIDEASARLDQELEVAKNIQSSALPGVFPPYPKRRDFDIFALMDPAKEVGGDFYDLYMTGTNRLHFAVADVSGKGIPGAMFMMRAKTELKSLTESEVPIDEVFTRGNAALCEGNDAGMFVTAWQGGIDLETGLVRFANAGHNPPLVRHGNGDFEYLRTRAGFVLAGMEGIKYRPQELQMEKGDIIFLYTDGVTEATNKDNELYGEERLQRALNSREFDSMRELCRYIKLSVDSFVGAAPQFDDITMMALRYIGTEPAPVIYREMARIEDIPEVTAFVEEELEKLGCPMKTVVQIDIAIDEIYSNIVRYGYKQPGPVWVEVSELPEKGAVCLKFTDEGVPYNPLKKEDPDVTLTAEERKIGGLGIYMVKKTMDEMKYSYENEKNILTLIKKIKSDCR